MSDILYDRSFFEKMGKKNDSAAIVLDILFQKFMPSTVLDVGCGTGTWAATAKELGVKSVCGIDGDYVSRDLLAIRPDEFRPIDLEEPFFLARKFDLVICTEVAEHLSRKRADNFIFDLTRHSDIVLFSAAAPFQGGEHHVNEQWLEYWGILFRKHGFAAVDFIRPSIWADDRVQYYFRQNLIVFAKAAIAETQFGFRENETRRALSYVHPIFLLISLAKIFPDMHSAAYSAEMEDCKNLTEAYVSGSAILPSLSVVDGVESVALGNGQAAAKSPLDGSANQRGYYFNPVGLRGAMLSSLLRLARPQK